MLSNSIKNKELFTVEAPYISPLFDRCEYPYEIIPLIGEYVRELILRGIPGFREYKADVLVGEGAEIHPSAVIVGPCVIGAGSVLRPGAYIRGSVIIAENCVIGNSTEIKNSVLLEGAKAPHYNYIGDSVIGSGAHLGAGVICSNLKADGSSIVIHAQTDIPTGSRKLGAIIADRADIGCGCVLNPGTVIGKATSVYPLNSLRGVFPANSIVKSQTNVVKRV